MTPTTIFITKNVVV